MLEYSYTFPEERPAKPDLSRVDVYPEKDPEEEVLGLIQGKRPQSKEEWRVAKALWALNHEFHYQFLVGLRGVRTSASLDFYVLTTVPKPTILEVYGEYWHSGEMGAEDEQRLNNIRQEFGDRAQVKILWGSELGSTDDAIVAVRRELGPG